MNGVAVLQPIVAKADKGKDLKMEILMERLRSKKSQYKTLADTSKGLRMNMLDKRWAVDSADRAILQRCLDSLQHCIQVSSLQSLKERIECLSRQLGLKFMVGATGENLFISSDMFYLEILLEASGKVKDVKIQHEGKMEQQSCEELVSAISHGDFADFTAQLEGLTAVYQLNAEKKVKCKAFSALQSLEADLCTLGQLQAFVKEPWAQVHKSPIGFLQKRRGGHAMRLTYFVSPYELLDKEKGTLQPLTFELIAAGKPSTVSNGLASLVAPTSSPIGHSATVLLEGSTSNKLQVSPIISVGQRQVGKNGPVYAPLGLQNSSMLPACFTLKLSSPMPLCTSLAKIIYATTEVECAGDWNNPRPLISLVVQHAYNKIPHTRPHELNIARGLFVSLPDQTQCYFVSESRGLDGCVVSSVPFTHPSHVPQLLACLRQQALFNTLLESCVRVQHRQSADLESMVMFEMSALSWQHISISLEHPLDETLATVELDLTDPAVPRAAVCTLAAHARDAVDEYISKVLQKSHSIPITLRALVKVWEREAAKQMNGYSALDNSNFSLGLGALDPGGSEADVKQEPGAGGHGGRALFPSNVSHPHQSGTYLSDVQQNLSILSQDTMVSEVKDDKISKKRKSDGETWPPLKRGKPVMSEIHLDTSSDSDTESEDEQMNSNSSNDERIESPVSQEDFPSDGESSRHDADVSEYRTSDIDNSADVDVDHVLRNSFHKSEHKKQKHKKDSERRNKISASSILMDLAEGKSYMPSSVSITPIGSGTTVTPNPLSSVLCLDRRPGIEIIPISSTPPPAALPSSITITPISSAQARSIEERHRSDKKSSRSEERGREKKKKKRREDPMGPPDKLPPKQDPLTKPVSVSIKPTEGSPRSTSPTALLRKFSPSPTHGRSVSITKSPSSSAIKSIGKPSSSSSHHTSPRHSPIQNSPKHLSGYSSPKNHSTSSPKHNSSSSGKPSMSTLKSAAGGSPSSKSTSGYDLSKVNKTSCSKDGYSSSSSSRDKEKKHSMSFSSGSSSPKIKPTSVKLKQLEITPILADTPMPEPLVSPPNVEVSKCAPSQVRNRKGSLSAVIDKLKSAQHCGSEIELSVTKTSSSGSSSSSKDRINTSSNKFADSKSGSSNAVKISENKNSEYMVKPSSDGMKITINKTRTKESSSNSSKPNFSSSSSSSSVKQCSTSPQLTAPSQGSPKTHTGLKPGVLSGPASKKTQVLQASNSSSKPSSTPSGSPAPPISSKSSTNINSITSSSSNPGSAPKVPYTKSTSSSMSGMNLSKSMSAKSSSGSPKSISTDLSKVMRDREREKSRMKLSGSSSEKSVFSNKSSGRSSPAPSRDEIDGDRFKSQSKDANFLVEGLIKPLDTSKFQIPKLKNQTMPDKSSQALGSQYDNRPVLNDFTQRSLEHGKYPFPHTPNSRNSPDLIQKSNYPLNVPKPPMSVGSTSPNAPMQPLKPEPMEISSKSQDSKSEAVRVQCGKEESACSSPTERAPYAPQAGDIGKGFSVPKMGCEDRKGADTGMKPPASGMVARSGATTPQEAAEILLDFSSSSASKLSGMVAVRPVYAAPATSLALHLVKSPAPSPLVVPSPHSNSPSCITDDELMDEALVGPSK